MVHNCTSEGHCVLHMYYGKSLVACIVLLQLSHFGLSFAMAIHSSNSSEMP